MVVSHVVDIECRGTRCTAALEASIRFWAARLDRLHGPIARCVVAIELAHRPGRRRRNYGVVLAVSGRGAPILVDRQGVAGTPQDLYVAVRDAFEDARRELQLRVGSSRVVNPDDWPAA